MGVEVEHTPGNRRGRRLRVLGDPRETNGNIALIGPVMRRSGLLCMRKSGTGDGCHAEEIKVQRQEQRTKVEVSG